MIRHSTPARPATRGRTLVVAAAFAVALVGCGDKAATDAGSGTPSGAPAATTTTTTTTTTLAPTTTTGSGATSIVTTTTGAPVVSPPSLVTTTIAKPGPSAAEVAELERALDDIDKLLTDMQTEMNDN